MTCSMTLGKSKKEGKDQASIQSSTTPDPGYQWEMTDTQLDITNESQDARMQKGDRGSGPPLINHQTYRVSLQYWSTSPENHKAFKPAFNVGPSSAR